MKSNEQLRKEFEEQTGNKAIVFPACHGETGYASWEYQLWLEQKLLEEYAQQSQPSGMRWVDDVNKIRGQAKAFGDKYSGSISEQAAAEVGFNAAINQVINILSESSPAGAAEGIKCKCPDNIKHGQTSVMCCNHCGLPDEDFWNNRG